jgi:pyroglutamyl-peptidase
LIAGFIHVPYLPEQVLDKPGVAGMALADIIEGLRAAVEVAVHGGVADGVANAALGGATH